MFHAQLGRFVSRDPLSSDPFYASPGLGEPTAEGVADIDGGNLYQYARGNPLSLTDPSGLDAKATCQCEGLDPRATGPCEIKIWVGDTLFSGVALKQFLNANTGDNAYKGSPYRLCPSQYLGVVGCGVFVPATIPADQQIPAFPPMPRLLSAALVVATVQVALRDARAFAQQLCKNRKTFCDAGTPREYDCGAGNKRCDSVTVTVSYDKYLARLLKTGLALDGFLHVPGLPNRESKALFKELRELRVHPETTSCK